MDNLEVAVGLSSGGVVDERQRGSRLPILLTVLAVALPIVAGISQYLAITGEVYDYLSGAAKVGKVLETTASVACVSGLLLAAASFLRRPVGRGAASDSSVG
ncbi:MAG: hypothetical protein ABMA25_16605 [Ilumatobacteraceae bacterium]